MLGCNLCWDCHRCPLIPSAITEFYEMETGSLWKRLKSTSSFHRCQMAGFLLIAILASAEEGPVVKLLGITHRANAKHKPKCFSKLDSVSSSPSHSKQGHRCLKFSFTRAKSGLLVPRGRQTQTYLNITFALSQIHVSQTEFSLIISRQKNYMNIFKSISWIAFWIITYSNKLINTFL